MSGDDMSEGNFKQGQEVQKIWFSEGDGGCFAVGSLGVEKITVVMENGQMAGVPWFAVWKEGRTDSKWNGALLGGVTL